jgi:hypothetical protein
MDEPTRMQASIDQITKRVDDFSFRLAAVENDRKSIDQKLDNMGQIFELKMSAIQRSVDGWNKIGFWLLTTVGTAVILAVLALVFVRPA